MEVTQAQTEKCYQQAEALHLAMLDRVETLETESTDDPVLTAFKSMPSKTFKAALKTASGYVTISAYFIGSQVSCELTYDDGKKIKFQGTAWGPGLGGLVVGGGGVFLPPEKMIGKCAFEIHGSAVVGGTLSVTFWNKSSALGTFVGAGGGVVAAIQGGEGEWKWA